MNDPMPGRAHSWVIEAKDHLGQSVGWLWRVIDDKQSLDLTLEEWLGTLRREPSVSSGGFFQ